MEPERVEHMNDSQGREHPELVLSRNRRFKPPRLPVSLQSSGPGESLNTIRQSNSSVWTKYIQGHDMDWDGDGLVLVAQCEAPSGKQVLVRQASKEGLYHKLRLLAQFRRQTYFPETFEVFISGSMMDIVCEYVDFALVHILRCPRLPTEKEAAAIAGQGSPIYSLFSSLS